MPTASPRASPAPADASPTPVAYDQIRPASIRPCGSSRGCPGADSVRARSLTVDQPRPQAHKVDESRPALLHRRSASVGLLEPAQLGDLGGYRGREASQLAGAVKQVRRHLRRLPDESSAWASPRWRMEVWYSRGPRELLRCLACPYPGRPGSACSSSRQCRLTPGLRSMYRPRTLGTTTSAANVRGHAIGRGP